MIGRATLAFGLWVLLAVVVFNVRFDWQVRKAGHVFVRSQVMRHQQGQPTLTINEAFRPMVQQAARDGALWALPFAAVGAAMMLVSKRNA